MPRAVKPQHGFGMEQKEPVKGEFSSEFLMYSYKVTPCGRKYPHDWASCPCGHKGERAARRDLRIHPYVAIACTYAKQKLPCPNGDTCPFAHSLFEYWLHPARYRTEVCQYGAQCERPVCFFAHNLEELRTLEESLPPAELCWSSGAITNRGGAAARAARPSHHQTQQQQHQEQQRMGAGSPPNGFQQQAQQQRMQRAVSVQLPGQAHGLEHASSLAQSAFARAASLGSPLSDSVLDGTLLPSMLSGPLNAPLLGPSGNGAWASLDRAASAAAPHEPWSALDRTASAPLHSPSTSSTHSSNAVDWKPWGGAGGLFETPTDGASPDPSPTSVLGGLPPPALATSMSMGLGNSMGHPLGGGSGVGSLARAHTAPLGGIDALLAGEQGMAGGNGAPMLQGLRSAFQGFEQGGGHVGATCVVSANGAAHNKASLFAQFEQQQRLAGAMTRAASLDGRGTGSSCNGSQAQQLANLITQMPDSMVDSLVTLLQAVHMQQVA